MAVTADELRPRRSGKDDYQIYSGSTAVGRVYKLPSVGKETWWWGIYIAHRPGPAPWNGIEDTFEAAKGAFRRAWDRRDGNSSLRP